MDRRKVKRLGRTYRRLWQAPLSRWDEGGNQNWQLLLEVESILVEAGVDVVAERKGRK